MICFHFGTLKLTLQTKLPDHVFSSFFIKVQLANLQFLLVLPMNSPPCSAKIKASKNCKPKYNPMTTHRFTKRPLTDNINISLDHRQIHLPKLMILMIPGTHPKQPRDPQEPLSETPGRPWATGHPKGTPEAPRGTLRELKIRPSSPTYRGGRFARGASGYNFLNFHRICIPYACIPYACIHKNIYHICRPLGVRWHEEQCCAPFRETSVACSTEP